TRRAGDDPRGRLLAVFDVLAELHAEDGPAASLLVNAIIEFPSSNDPTRRAAIRGKQSLTEMLLDMAASLGVAAPERLTRDLVLLIDGALLNQQITGDPDTLRAGRRLAAMTIDAAALPSAGH
ncbi:MAG: hypothetical protein AAGG46_10835, partial [Planctomycetota bacterium]